MAHYLFLAFAWTALGAIFLYRAYAGTRTVSILTLNHSDSTTLKKAHRRFWAFIGIGYLGLGIAYIVLAYVRTFH